MFRSNIILVLVGLMLSFPVSAVNQKMIQTKGKIPQGVIIKKNKVMIKDGYTVTKVSDTKADVIFKRNNNTTGSFECGCSAGGGGCKVVIEGNSVTCVESGECTKGVCSMTVSIPKLSVLQ